MKTLLLTGFEPFLQFKENPTATAVKIFDGETIGDYRIVGRVYPVAFDKINDLITRDLDVFEPDVVVNLGLAGGRHTIDIERIAINCVDGRTDNEGFTPDGEKIDESGPDGLFSTLPIKRLEKALKANHIPARISNSAGTYLCNNLMYTTLNHTRQKEKSIPAGFIHVPAHHEIGTELNVSSWSQDDINKAVGIILGNI